MASSNHKVDIVVGVKDLASSALRNIQNSFNNIGRGLNSAGTFMGAFTRNLDSAITKLDGLANSMYKFNMYTSSLQRNLQNITAIGAVAAGAIAVQGTKSALDYDYKMRTMQSRMGTTNAVRQNVSNYVLNSPDMKTAYKPTDIADIGIVLGQAGINTAQDMKSLMKSVSYFAESVDAAPDQAAEMVVAAAKGFGVSMKNSQQITDKLTVALNQSLLHVEELPHAIGELAGRANMYGQSFDSSLTALMTMRNQGVSAAQGSQDFLNAMRNVSRIGNDSTLYKKTMGYFQDLGINDAIFDPVTRKLKEFPDLIDDIEKAMVKQGFTNPRYNIKSQSDYENFLAANNGVAPSDFWDSMKAMPLISRVFGAAGTAPIIAGLQTKYDAVDANGNPTGQTYYGASALKQMYNQVHNSDGAVDQTHATIAESGKYQLEVLGNAWQTAQIKLLDGLVPLIKTGAEQLSNLFNPSQISRGPGQPLDAAMYEQTNPFKEMKKALDQTVQGYEKSGHPIIASTLNTLGNGAIGGIQIGQTMPQMFKPIMDAFTKDITNGKWGTNIATFPMSIVKNGIKFITDLFKANKEFNDAVKNLPTDLQDPAKLIETVTKGGIALMVSGVIIKTIELGIRGVSGLLKTGKTAANLSKAILGALMDKEAGPAGVGGTVAKALGSNMNIKANIVNVYGATVNGKGGGTTPGVGGGTATRTAAQEGERAAESAGQSALKSFASKVGPWALLGSNIALAAGSAYVLTHPKETNQMIEKNPIQKAVSQSPLAPQTDKKIDEMYNILKDPSKYKGPKAPGSTELKPTKNSNFFIPTVVKDKPSAASGATLADSKTTNALFSKLEKLASDNFGKSKADKDPGAYKEFVKNYNQITSTVKEGTGNMSNAIVSGFNTANTKLQNIKLNNQVAVNVAPPSVVVSGNIPKEFLTVKSSGSTGFTTTGGSPQGDMKANAAMNRLNTINQRRIGWGSY
jgi:TP901 family phage tail tape measure protein